MGQENINLLEGHRFDEEANLVYKLPVDELPKRKMLDTRSEVIDDVIDFESEDMIKLIADFIKHHQSKQVPRLKSLKRYYLADNNIKYRKAKSKGRADNRIASDFGKFIVSFKQGVLLGNPIKYSGDKKIADRINEFSEESNEDYHNQLMAVDTFTFGRAYEYIGRDEFGKETLAKLNAEETFVIYDTGIKKKSICAVHYPTVEFDNKKISYVNVYGNDGWMYKYKTENADYDNLKLDGSYQSYFDAVQINEWVNNEDRIGDFESVLDNIDAYDLSQSEMANFQQDSSEAYLVIKGNPDTGDDKEGENQQQSVLQEMINARMLILGDKKDYGDGKTGTDPDAYYLKKEYDTAGTEAYNNRLVADLLRFTSLIDFTDENIGSNQSGIGFRFKGWGSDNDRKNKERMVKKAIMRRLRLLSYSWNIKESLNEQKGFLDRVKSLLMNETKRQEEFYNKINKIEILFTPNVPQSDEEIMSVIAGMVGTVSDETIFEMASRLTGVSVEEELKRIKNERKEIPLTDEEKAEASKEQSDFLEKQNETDVKSDEE